MAIKEIKSFSKNIKIEGNLKVVKEDRDDDKFIECAYISNAKCIVSGDRHLLNLKSYKSIEILNARDFLKSNRRGPSDHDHKSYKTDIMEPQTWL